MKLTKRNTYFFVKGNLSQFIKCLGWSYCPLRLHHSCEYRWSSIPPSCSTCERTTNISIPLVYLQGSTSWRTCGLFHNVFFVQRGFGILGAKFCCSEVGVFSKVTRAPLIFTGSLAISKKTTVEFGRHSSTVIIIQLKHYILRCKKVRMTLDEIMDGLTEIFCY